MAKRSALALALLIFVAGDAAAYDDVYIQSLEDRIMALEAKSKIHNSKGSLELQTSDTVLSVGGRIRMETAYSDPSVGGEGGANNWDIGLSPASVNTSPQGEKGELSMSAKESRVWLKTRKPTVYGVLLSLIEVDFYGSNGNEKGTNSHGPRLRHAYMALGGLTIGQANSTFMGSGAPDTLHAPMDDIVIRQPLIRWSQSFDEGSLDLSLEQPESILLDSAGGQVTPDDDRLPDFAAKYVLYGLWGEVSLAGIARQIRADSDIVAGKSDTQTGGALHFSGRLKTFGVDDLRFGIASGDALGRYIGGASAVYAGGSIDNRGNIALQNTTGGHLSYQHWWSNEWRSTAAYGYVVTENNKNLLPGTADKRSHSAHINIQWSPIQNGLLGLEYIQALRELENGEEYTLDRFQFVASYDF